MYVSPKAQGTGIGGKLIRKALEWHGDEQEVYLHVVSYNDSAIGFYERYGFLKTGKILPEEYDEEHELSSCQKLRWCAKELYRNSGVY
jgi:ribosomal protein S18 acetylase RimI-like enzyme